MALLLKRGHGFKFNVLIATLLFGIPFGKISYEA